MVKIGSTYEIDARLRSLQTGCPYPLKVLAIMPGGRQLEKELQKRFASYLEMGEWFSLKGDLKEYIDELRSLKES